MSKKKVKIETTPSGFGKGVLEGYVLVKTKGLLFWRTVAGFSIFTYGLDKAFRLAKQVKKELEANL